MKKKFTAVILTLVLGVSMFGSAFASSDFTASATQSDDAIKIDGDMLSYDETSYGVAMLADNRSYVPIRIISEKLGLSVSWDNDSQTATITGGSNGTITMKSGDYYITVDGEIKESDVPAVFVYNNRTYCALRVFCEEGLGYTVKWTNYNGIEITTGQDLIVGKYGEQSAKYTVNQVALLCASIVSTWTSGVADSGSSAEDGIIRLYLESTGVAASDLKITFFARKSTLVSGAIVLDKSISVDGFSANATLATPLKKVLDSLFSNYFGSSSTEYNQLMTIFNAYFSNASNSAWVSEYICTPSSADLGEGDGQSYYISDTWAIRFNDTDDFYIGSHDAVGSASYFSG